MKTFIRWQGNKSKHLRKIEQYLPKTFNTYYEPFVGSGALLLYLQPEKWVINDKNVFLIILWKLIKSDPEFLLQEIHKMQTSFDKLNKQQQIVFCKEHLSHLTSHRNIKQKAIIFLFVMYQTYMGILSTNNNYRFPGLNSKGLPASFNENILKIHNFLKIKGKIYQKDYTYILEMTQKDDFVFLDPPYHEAKNYEFFYNKDESINYTFIERLKHNVQLLDKKKVKWMMTQADTKEVREVFKDYNIHTYKVYRASSKQYKDELVIRNYK